MDISEIIYPLSSPLSTAIDEHWSCSQLFTITEMWIWTFVYSILWTMLSFSLGKWSESLRSGMAGLFDLNCALIHILINSELNSQFLCQYSGSTLKSWNVVFPLPPSQGICPKLCTFCQLPQAVMIQQALPFTLLCSQWHQNSADSVSAPNELRQSHRAAIKLP